MRTFKELTLKDEYNFNKLLLGKFSRRKTKKIAKQLNKKLKGQLTIITL